MIALIWEVPEASCIGFCGGSTVDVIAQLVQTSPDRVRELIHRFNERWRWSAWTADGRMAVPA